MSAPLVPATVVAARLACSSRYVLMLAEQGKITAHRIGKKCVRFDMETIERELGIAERAKKGGDQ